MVTRKAILICSPDEGDAQLPGTSLDVRNLKNYLMSPRGGAWRDDEIVVFENPLFYSAYQAVIGALVDYLLVYFSGHGATVHGERMIKFLDGLAVDQGLVTGHSPGN